MAEYIGRKKRNYKKSFRYVPVTVLLFLAAMLIGVCGFFRVTDIEVTGANMYTPEEIIEAAGIQKGDSLVFFNGSKIGASIVGKLSYAGDVRVAAKYPSTVAINLKESIPVASVQNGGNYWIIDADGKLLEQTNRMGAGGTIAITGIEIKEPEIGSVMQATDNTKLTYLKEILNAAVDNGVYNKITRLDISSIANITFDFEGRITVKFGDGSDSTKKFNSLVGVYNHLDKNSRGSIQITNSDEIHFIPA